MLIPENRASEELETSFIDRVKAYKVENNLTLNQLALELNMGNARLNNLLSARTPITLKTAYLISVVTGIGFY